MIVVEKLLQAGKIKKKKKLVVFVFVDVLMLMYFFFLIVSFLSFPFLSFLSFSLSFIKSNNKYKKKICRHWF